MTMKQNTYEKVGISQVDISLSITKKQRRANLESITRKNKHEREQQIN